MSSQSPTLPFSSDLDIAALSRLFANTTNSYKFIFFLSYLDILKRREFNASDPIGFRDLVVEMLANVWYPHTYFKLSFGLRDMITARLDSLNLVITEPILKFRDPDKQHLRAAIGDQVLDNNLLRYVPYRTLRPFFEEEVRGIADYKVDLVLADLSSKHFAERNPLYTFTKSRDGIIPNPLWMEYLKLHFWIIRGWAAWHWLEYMQRCNPAVPAISAKLFPPRERDSLKFQTEYWTLVIDHGQVNCIYSDKQLKRGNFSLDHFVPWSFVAHDQLWNLIPTLPEVNSAKSNSLPASGYFEGFVALQHHGLITSKELVGERKWEKYIESYIADLRIGDAADLLNPARLRRAYEANLKPQIELAKTLGFQANWRYRSA